MDNRTGISELYTISAKNPHDLAICFTVHGLNVTRNISMQYDADFVAEVQKRFEELLSLPFEPTGIFDQTNSTKDGFAGHLPYSSYATISDDNRLLCIYFDKSFKETPFTFVYRKPKSGKVFVSNFLDIEIASVVTNDAIFQNITEELNVPLKIDRMLSAIDDVHKLSNVFLAIESKYNQNGFTPLVEIELEL